MDITTPRHPLDRTHQPPGQDHHPQTPPWTVPPLDNTSPQTGSTTHLTQTGLPPPPPCPKDRTTPPWKGPPPPPERTTPQTTPAPRKDRSLTHPPPPHGNYGQCVGSKHPTGMHSSLLVNYHGCEKFSKPSK